MRDQSRRVLILGSGPLATTLIEEIESAENRRYTVAGTVDDQMPEPASAGYRRWIGPLESLAEIINRVHPAFIVVAMADRRDRLPLQMLLDARVSGIVVEDALDFSERLMGKLAIDPVSQGLTEIIENPATTLDSVTHTLRPYNLSILPAGLRQGAVHQILRSPRLEGLIAHVRQRYDFVVLDTPPLLPVFDSALLANAVDGVLVVVAANQTPRKLLGEALNMLDPAKVLGIVFNRDAKPLFGYYDAYYKDYFPEHAVTEA
jgi:hypothetical protein